MEEERKEAGRKVKEDWEGQEVTGRQGEKEREREMETEGIGEKGESKNKSEISIIFMYK